MKFIKKIGKIAAIAGLAALPFMTSLKAEDKPKKMFDGIYSAVTLTHGERGTGVGTFATIYDGKGDKAAFYHEKNEDSTSYIAGAARADFNLEVFKGNIRAFGERIDDETFGVGLNSEATLSMMLVGDVLLNTALEKVGDDEFVAGYLGKKFNVGNGNVLAKFGVSDLSGDKTYTGAACGSLDSYVAGAAYQARDNDRSDTFAATFGKTGPGFGGRTFVKTDFEGNYVVDAIFGKGSNVIYPKIKAPVEIDNGILDESIATNLLDAPFWDTHRWQDTGVQATYARQDTGDSSFKIDGAHHLKFGKIMPFVQVGYTLDDIAGKQYDGVRFFEGVKLDGRSSGGTRFVFGQKFKEGQKPEYMVKLGYDKKF